MTFTEAAAQVLRLVGKPLHYKEITDVAIEKNLLSHVGKSPEVTMGARLAALVKKAEKDNPLVRVKPGVFALREWDDKAIKAGLADRTPALQLLADNGSEEGADQQEAKPGEEVSADAEAVEAEEVAAPSPEHAPVAIQMTGISATVRPVVAPAQARFRPGISTSENANTLAAPIVHSRKSRLVTGVLMTTPFRCPP